LFETFPGVQQYYTAEIPLPLFIMKKIAFGLFLCLSFAVLSVDAYSQNKVIVLVRHAEKTDGTSQDPELSAAGKERAQRLIKKVNKYRPKEIYSTDFKRTRDTVQPLAAKRHLQVQTYDPKDPKTLAAKILASPSRRVLVAGHSNTVPGLANLLGKKELFKNLDDAEYGAIWVIRMKKGEIQKIEILNY
jgi:2,3-bisphosphoglycerate-dependent phosphoglycerate mutase